MLFWWCVVVVLLVLFGVFTMAIPGPHQDVIPASDTDFATFAGTFQSLWVPATFNTVLPSAASVTSAVNAFASACVIALAPATRTPVAVAAKDAARATAAGLIRDAIRACQAAFLGGFVTEAAINALGVRANNLVRTPIGAPVYGPLVAIDAVFAGFMRFRVTQVDQMTGFGATTRRFDYGLVGVEVERKVGAGAFIFRQSIKRVLFSDPTVDCVAGDVASFRLRYATARGLVSPWSSIVSAVAQ